MNYPFSVPLGATTKFKHMILKHYVSKIRIHINSIDMEIFIHKYFACSPFSSSRGVDGVKAYIMVRTSDCLGHMPYPILTASETKGQGSVHLITCRHFHCSKGLQHRGRKPGGVVGNVGWRRHSGEPREDR